MKKYNKPEIIVEDINVEDIMEVSKRDRLDNFGDAQSVGFDDLWKI